MNPADEINATRAGACELGLLEEGWEHFFVRAKQTYLFVIDAPAVSSIHALPPHNIPHFGLSSLLPCPDAPKNITGMSLDVRQRHFAAEAEQYPLTLALTELLARYIFTDRWSSGRPKLISNHQVAALTRILNTVESYSIEEIKRATRSVGSNDELRSIRDLLIKVSSTEMLVQEVEQHLQTILPGVYGAYTTTRQLFRYHQVLPFVDDNDEPSTFLDSFSEIRSILEESNADIDSGLSLEALYAKWSTAIPPSPTNSAFAHRFPGARHTSESAKSHGEHARTLAEIEYLNRGFARRGQRYRLVFVTPTGRLFRANLKRFDMSRFYSGRVRYGSSDSFDKFMYQATLLGQPDGEMSMLPMLDPRVLMTSPDFVAYASRSSDTVSEYSSRSISSWIPLLLSPLRSNDGRIDVQRLWNLYEALKVGSTSKAIHAEQETEFRLIDESSVRRSWNAYIRTIAAAESSERLMRRDSLSELRAAIFEGDGDGTSLKAVIMRRLDSTMSLWLSYVGGTVIKDIVARRQTASEDPFQVFMPAPPLIMPALSSDDASIEDLASDLGRIQSADRTSAWLTEQGFVHPSIRSDDEGREFKTRYLQILGQSRLFAELEDWESSHTLADQAFSLAENILSSEADKASPTYISGREAAFYASFSLRRVPSSRAAVDQHIADGKAWVSRLAAAISSEPALVDATSIRQDLHVVRARYEELAWGFLRGLYQLQDREGSTQIGAGLIGMELLQLATEYDELIAFIKGGILPAMNVTSFSSHRSFVAYERTTAYVLREATLDRIEIEILARRSANLTNREKLSSLLVILSAGDAWLNLRGDRAASVSVREGALVAASKRILASAAAVDAWQPDSRQRLSEQDAWRMKRILTA